MGIKEEHFDSLRQNNGDNDYTKQVIGPMLLHDGKNRKDLDELKVLRYFKDIMLNATMYHGRINDKFLEEARLPDSDQSFHQLAVEFAESFSEVMAIYKERFGKK